ncbi:dihydrofolate reductase [Legionella quinlivanii]|uniref:Dihydrofolate reductase n=2 Tax=Legionella quinlivanii TaxID=45073 RepID=A0A0W0XKJ1_9GAMM|nr:dihydrofolate reductase [Legionella quinlivanii]SEG05751.1 Dihydrofolate reductase [Legionella quinlivanii DSM 21216]STY11517.1 dihydrofolate reductase [Legionella quinlivanii]
MSKIILYIATSEDGYIADKNGGADWLPHPKDDHDLEVVGYKKLMQRIDIILMGSSSFKQIIGFGNWGWTNKHTYVFSKQVLKAPLSCITITNDSPSQFIKKIRENGTDKDIWLLGGANLAKSFAEDRLIDEIILTIVPQILGDGIPLGLSFDNFYLTNEEPLMDNIIQRTYLRNQSCP